jgi:photosystem I subunit 10
VRRASVAVRADGGFIGSSTNVIMVAATGLTLAAGRFGLAPTVKQGTTAGLKLVDRSNAAGIISNDPAGALLCRLGSYHVLCEELCVASSWYGVFSFGAH